jgi:hypothetical protein
MADLLTQAVMVKRFFCLYFFPVLSFSFSFEQQGVEPCEISVLHFLNYMRAGGGPLSCAEVVNGAQEERVVGGTNQITMKLAEMIQKRGGRVLLSHPVVEIEQNTKQVRIQTKNGSLYTADFVIVAIPPNQCCKIEYKPPLSVERQMVCHGWSVLLAFSQTHLSPFLCSSVRAVTWAHTSRAFSSTRELFGERKGCQEKCCAQLMTLKSFLLCLHMMPLLKETLSNQFQLLLPSLLARDFTIGQRYGFVSTSVLLLSKVSFLLFFSFPPARNQWSKEEEQLQLTWHSSLEMRH